MTAYLVGPGQTSSGITLNSGDVMYVVTGGTTLSTTLNSGGTEFLYDNGAPGAPQ
jgi:autotransporter passenger strand-loop-strand repeat protein